MRHYVDDALTVAEGIRDQQRDLASALEAGDREAELGRYDEARACCTEALALRRERGDAGLIASTQEALDEIDRRQGA